MALQCQRFWNVKKRGYVIVLKSALFSMFCTDHMMMIMMVMVNNVLKCELKVTKSKIMKTRQINDIQNSYDIFDFT